MNLNTLCFLLLIVCAVPASRAAKQFVEIERRPGNNHDLAGTFSFVFGLATTFIALLIMILFVGAFLRSSSIYGVSTFKEPATPQLILPSISTITKQTFSFSKP